jgi:hypothetical protein
MTSIFSASFINTAIILLLTNANLDFTPLSFIPIRNEYDDFNENWYTDIGLTLRKTMVFSAVFPYIEFIGFYMLRVISRMRDSGFAILSDFGVPNSLT